MASTSRLRQAATGCCSWRARRSRRRQRECYEMTVPGAAMSGPGCYGNRHCHAWIEFWKFASMTAKIDVKTGSGSAKTQQGATHPFPIRSGGRTANAAIIRALFLLGHQRANTLLNRKYLFQHCILNIDIDITKSHKYNYSSLINSR